VKWLVMSDLAALKKLPASWTAINKLIKQQGFPPGRIVGRNRIWLEQEVDDWHLSRSTAKCKLRGRAKTLVEASRPPEHVKPGPSVGAEGTGRELTNSLSTSRNIGSDPESQEAA